MAIITKASAKTYFLTGAFPTQSQFGDTIDSYLGLGEASLQTVSGQVNFASGIKVSGNTLGTAAFKKLATVIIDDGSGNLTIGNNVVTNAMAAQMAAHTVKANITGSTANETDSTSSAFFDAEIGAAQGEIPVRGASVWSNTGQGAYGTSLVNTVANTPAWGALPYAQFQDQKTQNTAGGTFSSGSWQQRVLQTSVKNTITGASLTTNQILLPAGTYYTTAYAAAHSVQAHQTRLYNVTDSAVILLGQSGNIDSAAGSTNGYAVLSGQFTISATKTIELDHQCSNSQATNGFGLASNFSTEVYANIEIWKIG